MDDYAALLEQFGLSDKESALYIALLELGQADVAAIAKKADVKRPTAYVLLDTLREKGFVSLQDGGSRQFQAEDPRKILAFERSKVAQLEKVLPGMLGLASTSELKPGTRFFSGKDGIKAVYEESLLQLAGSEMLAIGNAEAVERSIEDFQTWYIKRRAELGIPMRAIIPATPDGLKVAVRDAEELRETRLIEPGDFTEPVEVNIYGNKVSAVSFVENELIGVIIESKVLANVHRQIFELLWRSARKQ
ncbi:MAG TPA: helix-turn-helix domain-containing protein [Candidatus Saccharimonadales bacterium]|nr:helix-turn-helix domain-containing protein [Candidatus Saccharimonadales bacterium]